MERSYFGNVAVISYKPRGDRGEDAFAYDFSREGFYAQAVFDGCGGSGAWKYKEYREASGAFVASHELARVFLAWFKRLSAKDTHEINFLSESWGHTSYEALRALMDHCAPMVLKGSLVKSFPSTAAVSLICQGSNNLVLTALNAGDSRVYFLTPKEGLIQFTRDDSKGNPDALDSLRTSPGLSNLICADRPGTIRAEQVYIPLPCAVINATDGMFAYLRSPMDFEFTLLHALYSANTLVDFETLFREMTQQETTDDSTCVLSFYGWSSFQAIKQDFYTRYEHLKRIVSKLDQADSDPEIVNQEWNRYKRTTVFGREDCKFK